MNWLKKAKWWLAGLAILAVIGGSAGYAYIYQSHPSIDDRAVRFKGSVAELMKEVVDSAEVWTNAVVEISGEVQDLDGLNCALAGGVFCQFDSLHPPTMLREGQAVNLKGRLIGFDELLDEIKLDQCKSI